MRKKGWWRQAITTTVTGKLLSRLSRWFFPNVSFDLEGLWCKIALTVVLVLDTAEVLEEPQFETDVTLPTGWDSFQ